MSNSQPRPSIFSISAAAFDLNVSQSTLRRMAKAGRIRIVKVNERAAGILREDLDKLLAEISQS